MCSSTKKGADERPGAQALHIRPMSSADASCVAGLEALCFPCGWDEGQYREALQEGTVFGAVCLDTDGDIIGYAAASGVLDEMEILNVAVRADRRRMGAASILLCAVLQEACERNIVICHLEVRKGNVPARTLYEHAGFIQAGLRKKYYADNGEDALIMTLDLRSWQRARSSHCSQCNHSGPAPYPLQETL